MTKYFHFILSILVLWIQVGAYLVSPPGPVGPETASDCSSWVGYSSTFSSCSSIEGFFGITEAEFEEWNPIVTESGENCTLIPDLYYCIQINFNPVSMSTTATTSTTITTTPPITTTTTSGDGISTTTPPLTTTTTSGDGISTPTPIQTGMASNCNKFYLVASGDNCETIAMDEGISLTEFYTWNPAVGTNCEYLDLGDYVCVDVIGIVPSQTTTTTTSTIGPGNGITTPTPYQTGMVTNCDLFHLVVSGDECGDIATQYGISLTQFYSWNPAVGSTCSFLDLGDYVCVGAETCTSASVLAGQPQSQLICGAPGASHDNSGSLLITSYTAGSSYVESAAACGNQCIATPSCTNLYFIEGSYCNLHEGAFTFAESTTSPYYLWYDAACFYGNGTCGVPGASHDNSGSLLITSYTAGSPYVESAAACGAQCLATASCTNLYFIEGSYCNLHEGVNTFAESTVAPFYYWYDASCFSSGNACGSYGFSEDNPSTLIVSYTSGSPYVESAAACGAQCLSTSGCTNVYFTQGSYCNLHSPSTFYASTASGYFSWYQSGCFACNALSV